MGWLDDKYQDGGWLSKYDNIYSINKFLQPTSGKLPNATRVPYRNLSSSEVSISIGGENGEPAYLIPSFKHGKFLDNPVEEYNQTGEHLGGPFKTWQEADKYAREVRHPYVEKGQDIPIPIRTGENNLQDGGDVSKELDEITVYGKKKYADELKKQQAKYLADMSKYKKDSAQWVSANKLYNDSLNAYNGAINNWEREIAIDQKQEDKELIELLDNDWMTAAERQDTKDYLNKGRGRYHTYQSRMKGRDSDYNTPPANLLGKEEYDNTVVKGEYRGLGESYPVAVDNYTASVLRNKNTVQPVGMVSTSEGGAHGLFKKPTKKAVPNEPNKPANSVFINYDPTYENLNMRSLWANIAKQDTSKNIGTLHNLDPQYKKGFTLEEALKFPKEVRDKYNIDYIGKRVFKNGGIVKDDNGYWNPDNWGKPVEINSNQITMKGINESLIGISDTGDVQYMEPNNDYKFKGKKVTEIPVAQDGISKKKKAYIFTETPIKKEQFNITRNYSNIPSELKNIQKLYSINNSKRNELQYIADQHRRGLNKYVEGYYGIPDATVSDNLDNTTFKGRSGYINSEEDIDVFKKSKAYKRYIDSKNEYDSLVDSIYAASDSFYDHPLNIIKEHTDNTFNKEGEKLKKYYNSKGIESQIIPLYGESDTTKVNDLNITSNDDVVIFGHNGYKYGDIPNEWWNKKVGAINPDRCLLGSCYGDQRKEDFKDVKNLYRTTDKPWSGVNPKADSIESAMFSTTYEKTVNPVKGIDYEISNVKKDGGNIPLQKINKLTTFTRSSGQNWLDKYK